MNRRRLLRELEGYFGQPNVLGLLRRIRDSKFYRKSPAGRAISEPTDREMQDVLSRAKQEDRMRKRGSTSRRIAQELLAVAREMTAVDSRLLKRDVAKVNKALSVLHTGVRELNGIVRKSTLPESPAVEKMMGSISDAMDALDDAGDTFLDVQREA